MTILQALDRYYDRLAANGKVEQPGWSREKFGWCIVIDRDGSVVDAIDLRDTSGKKPVVQAYPVPAGVKRTVGIAPNLFWDKTAYALGRTAGEGRRTAQEHARFVEAHLALLADATDEGLVALRRFLEGWTPERFDEPPFRAEMLDANIMFRLADDPGYLHQRPAARALVAAASPATNSADDILCLVTGNRGPLARLHPTIKGVEGSQPSGASLVSFNLDAFSSYGKDQGANAPTSQAAAFRYGEALNRLLVRHGPNRIARPVGDATTLFWADATNADPAAADAADDWFQIALDPDGLEDDAAARLKAQLNDIAAGRPLREVVGPDLDDGLEYYILGLAPNAARLSVRFWEQSSFGALARRVAMHYADCRIRPEPRDWAKPPSVRRLLAQTTAMQGKFENIPPLLAGEVMRSVLTGAPYPRSLMAATIMRLRAGDDPGRGWHAAVLRASLVRARRNGGDQQLSEGEMPMALDREHRNTGYLLGRLFAVYELAQVAALGRNVKATMRDKYFGSASATPASIFPLVISNGQNHLSKARKNRPGWAFLIERELGAIMDLIAPSAPHSLPRSLKLEDQAEFAIGYYHQRSAKLSNDKGDTLSLAEQDQENAANEGEDTND
jgi:CRISPR-associated protein Csd1